MHWRDTLFYGLQSCVAIIIHSLHCRLIEYVDLTCAAFRQQTTATTNNNRTALSGYRNGVGHTSIINASLLDTAPSAARPSVHSHIPLQTIGMGLTCLLG